MVFLCFHLQIRRKIGSFLDSLRIHVRGGVGGMGQPKYGGTGGKGGSVIIQAQESMSVFIISCWTFNALAAIV